MTWSTDDDVRWLEMIERAAFALAVDYVTCALACISGAATEAEFYADETG